MIPYIPARFLRLLYIQLRLCQLYGQRDREPVRWTKERLN